MKIKKTVKRFVTLIEVLVVMALIAVLATVLGFNIQASMDKGKAFSTEQNMSTITKAISLYISEHPDEIDHIESDWQSIVSQSPLVGNSKAVIRDGWGNIFRVQVDTDDVDGDARVMVISEAYNRYKRKK